MKVKVLEIGSHHDDEDSLKVGETYTVQYRMFDGIKYDHIRHCEEGGGWVTFRPGLADHSYKCRVEIVEP